MVEKEMEDILSNGDIISVNQEEVHFLSKLVLIPKNDRNQRPAINMKQLNYFIP